MATTTNRTEHAQYQALSVEFAAQLVAELAAAGASAKVTGGGDGPARSVTARIVHPKTGNAATWNSYYATEIPAAADIVRSMKVQLGMAVQRTRSAIRAEKAQS